MKQQQLTFEKGMTNVPSDAICSDNTLEDSTNMIYRDGEHHVIQRPALSDDSATMKLVFVHKLGNGTSNYIYEGTVNNVTSLYYNGQIIFNSGHSGEPIKSITSIGNTLIVSFDGRLGYFLYNGSGYKDISRIPAPNVEFRMGMDSGTDPDNYAKGFSVVNNTGNHVGILNYNPTNGNFYITNNGDSQEKYNNLIVGLYYKNLNSIKEKMGFAEPFCARVALEMYDGSYTCITNPVILLPAITKSSSAKIQFEDTTIYTNYSLLYCKLKTDYSDYSEIVKDVVVFISDGVHIYDTTVDQPSDNRNLWPVNDGVVLTNCIAYNTEYPSDIRSKLVTTYKPNDEERFAVLKQRPQKDIEDELARQSVFYRLCPLGTSEMNDYEGVADKIHAHTLGTLTTQEQLKYDDFYSLCPLEADFLYSYNNRLNAAGIKRGFFQGFDFFLPYDNSFSSAYTAYVTIKTPEGEKVIAHTYTTNQQQGIWFYYPDPRASHVYIHRQVSNICVCDADLTEHPGLNGAFYFKGLLTVEGSPSGSHTSPTPTDSPQEDLSGYLLTSEVNNPFIFRASGYNRVGTGTIIGMASQTQALSQGQFGQYPLLVFTTEGIWAMSLNNTGLFTAIHPMSREVALESNPAITPVDGAVFFVSKKGLMVVEGSKVVCVSEQLKGKGFDSQDYFGECFIAYDYRDSLLWIFNETIRPEGGLVYSIKSGTYALVGLPFAPVCVVNNYPDYLIQDDEYKVYTLYGRAPVFADENTYNCFIKSRPMKLENGLALKRIIQIMHIMDLDYDAGEEDSGMTFSMKGSNDLKNWCQLTSVRSVPWKYYQFSYTFKKLEATSTFSGTVITTEEVRTNKLR